MDDDKAKQAGDVIIDVARYGAAWCSDYEIAGTAAAKSFSVTGHAFMVFEELTDIELYCVMPVNEAGCRALNYKISPIIRAGGGFI